MREEALIEECLKYFGWVDSSGIHGAEKYKAYADFIIAKLKEQKAGFIVDLYEVRSRLNRPLSLREVQPIEDIHKYNFFNSLIAQFSHEYNVQEEEIKEEIHRRTHKKDLDSLLKS